MFTLHWVYWKKSNAKQNTAMLLEKQSQKTHKIQYNLLAELNWFSVSTLIVSISTYSMFSGSINKNVMLWFGYMNVYTECYNYLGPENFKSLHKLLRIDLQTCLYVTLYTTFSLKTARLEFILPSQKISLVLNWADRSSWNNFSILAVVNTHVKDRNYITENLLA